MIRRECYTVRLLAAVGVFLLSIHASISAQDTRSELIDAARSEPDIQTAVGLYRAALNPNLSDSLDVLWDEAVIELAEMLLLDVEDEELASVWLRWAVRLRPELSVDPELLAEETAAALVDARAFVGEAVIAASQATTTWNWDSVGADDRGVIELLTEATPPDLEVRIAYLEVEEGTERNVGVLSLDQATITLAPGSYVLRASAAGHDSAAIMREVVPAASTRVGYNLVEVVAELPEPQPTLPDSVIDPRAEASALHNLGRLSVRRYGIEPTCGAGAFVGSAGLFVTTYRAIRGAESIEVRLSDGTEIRDGIAVAEYDTAGVAVLQLPHSVEDSLPVTDGPESDQYVWALGFPDCGTAAVLASRAAGRSAGGLHLSDSLAFGDQGGPLVDQRGSIVGLTVGGADAVPADVVRVSLAQARSNIRSQRLLSLMEVSETESHRYGAVSISSDLDGSVVRVTPMERWHWQDAGGGGPLPFTFAGPMGRYRIQMLLGSQVHRTEEFTLNPAVTQTLALLSQVAVETPGEQQAAIRTGGGKFPWPIALIGLAGAGAAVGILALGGGDGPTSTCPSGQHWDPASNRCVPNVTTGGIIIDWTP